MLDLTPSIETIKLTQIANASFRTTITDALGEVVDISADAIRFTVMDYWGGTTLLQNTNASGSHSDPVNGKTVFEILLADTALWNVSNDLKWVYEIRRIRADAKEYVHIKGTVEIKPGL